MTFVLGHLPDGANEESIRELFSHFAYVITNVTFFEKSKVCCHSEYECMVKLNITNPVVGCYIQKRMNNYCWKGTRIHSHMLIF